MLDVILTSSILKFVMAAIAIIVVWMILRFLDHLSGFNFKGYLNEEEYEASIGVCLYLGARFIGACILVGFLFS